MQIKFSVLFVLLISLLSFSCERAEKINRHELVRRHNVLLSEPDSLAALTVGNGRFAMTVDLTGLQTFPDFYENGVPLGTLSEWGWHAFPTSKTYKIEETDVLMKAHGREIPYAGQWPSGTPQGEAATYIRQNPHRIHLAQLGWKFQKRNGELASFDDLKLIEQELDNWTGEIKSLFLVDMDTVKVLTFSAQSSDQIFVKVSSNLVSEGRIKVSLKYPFPSDTWADKGNFFDKNEAQRLTMTKSEKEISIDRELDSLRYSTILISEKGFGKIAKTENGFLVEPNKESQEWTFSCAFQKDKVEIHSGFDQSRIDAEKAWESFWTNGGIIDFGQVKDARAKELERRMVLSLYLTKVNCGGESPPQETGLTYNSWYGKPHMEMAWWHGVHFALWNRSEILEDQLEWYLRNWQIAEGIAKRQGFRGVRWQKMTDNNGQETASSVGSYLIWQQPHFIYMAELLYRQNPNSEVLARYADLIEKTAEFMVDYVYHDPALNRGILGVGLIPAQESHSPEVTFNPTYELAYWRWAIEKAQDWRVRTDKPRNAEWDAVLATLSPLPQKNGLYLATENTPDCYENDRYLKDHPSVFGAFGMLPTTKGLDVRIMENTFAKIEQVWHWNETWGCDFPMTAMTATRLNLPEKAIDALLMPIATNRYLKNGHNYQDQRLTLYLPGNGGFLAALAMMAAGYDDAQTEHPGFPKDWDLSWEGLSKMP